VFIESLAIFIFSSLLIFSRISSIEVVSVCAEHNQKESINVRVKIDFIEEQRKAPAKTEA